MDRIPKTIHYCWFGRKPKPEQALTCIESWKKHCPEYELIEWNEDNFDINQNLYVKQAYEAKKFAFVTDYVRLYALYNYGGIYMDTDVEVVKPLDRFLVHSAFSGFENNNCIPTGIMAAEKGNQWVKDLLDEYKDVKFIKEDGEYDLTTNVVRITNLTKEKYGIKLESSYQDLNDIVVMYPYDYFCPKDWYTGKINCTENTHTIHHFSGSWHNEEQKETTEKLRKKANKYIEKYGEEKGKIKFNKHETYVSYLKSPKKLIKRVFEKIFKK